MGERKDVAPRIRAGELPGYADTVLRGQRRRGGGRYPRAPRALVGCAGQELLRCGLRQWGCAGRPPLGLAGEIRAYRLREHGNADLELRRHLIEHRLHDRGHALHRSGGTWRHLTKRPRARNNLLQIAMGGGVDFFKIRPPSGRGGARFLQHVAPDRPFYGHTARRNPPRKYLILQAENR